MTAAFNDFMREYKMTGSEKADGYSQSVFIGLDDQEKNEVFSILLTELPYSAHWLIFLDRKKALPIIKQNEKEMRGNGYARVYLLQEELIKCTGDLSYQEHMIHDYPGYVDYLRPLAVDAIGRSPTSPASINFLKQIILTETDSDAVARATRRLLSMLKVPRSTEIEQKNYFKLTDELLNENTTDKLKAFRALEKFEDRLLHDEKITSA